MSVPAPAPTAIMADLQERLTDWRSLHAETQKVRGLLNA
jgi:hypothetical protein